MCPRWRVALRAYVSHKVCIGKRGHEGLVSTATTYLPEASTVVACLNGSQLADTSMELRHQSTAIFFTTGLSPDLIRFCPICQARRCDSPGADSLYSGNFVLHATTSSCLFQSPYV